MRPPPGPAFPGVESGEMDPAKEQDRNASPQGLVES